MKGVYDKRFSSAAILPSFMKTMGVCPSPLRNSSMTGGPHLDKKFQTFHLNFLCLYGFSVCPGRSAGARTRSTLKEGIFDRQFPTLLKKRKQNGVCVVTKPSSFKIHCSRVVGFQKSYISGNDVFKLVQ